MPDLLDIRRAGLGAPQNLVRRVGKGLTELLANRFAMQCYRKFNEMRSPIPSLGVDFSSLTVHLQYTPISIVSGVPRIGGAAPDEAVPPRCVFVINDWEIDVVDVPLCIAEDRVKKGEMSLKTDAEP